LIATNTIAQGDTREGGLTEILRSGGQVYSAVRRLRWPGQAAVIVSPVHIAKNLEVKPPLLDGKPVERISAFLLPGTVDQTPNRLQRCPYFSAGSKIYGQGFVFDDQDPAANPVALLERIRANEPASAARILPYIGGEEVNAHPSHQFQRHVIFLSDVESEDELRRWPMLMDIVRSRVKPERDALGENPNNIPLKRRWWAYQAHRPELYGRIQKLNRVLVNSQVSGHLAFAFLPTGWIYAHTLNVFEICTSAGFAVLQSRVHEIWARLLGSSMKDDLRYTPSDCFETFPFLAGFDKSVVLEEVGRAYYQCREKLMGGCGEGMTTIYNWFHDPECALGGIMQLRQLHDEMDRAVLKVYGWDEIQPSCEFFPEFDDEAEEAENGRPRRRRYRYRWPEEARDRVLARLLDLNRQCALEEGQLPTAPPVFAGPVDTEPKTKRRKTVKQPSGALDQSLLSLHEGDA